MSTSIMLFMLNSQVHFERGPPLWGGLTEKREGEKKKARKKKEKKKK